MKIKLDELSDDQKKKLLLKKRIIESDKNINDIL